MNSDLYKLQLPDDANLRCTCDALLRRSRRWVFALIVTLSASAFAAETAPSLRGSPESEVLSREFPFLGKLLTADNPWEMEPKLLAQVVFARMPGLTQGSDKYPLLYSDRREKAGWPGEKVFNLYAYESEYYTFDREYPVLKLHIGRPAPV